MTTATFNPIKVSQSLELLHGTGQAFEIRIIDAPTGNGYKSSFVGYFDDLTKATGAISAWAGKANVYTILNQIDPALLARYYNRLEKLTGKTDTATPDKHIIKRCWLPIDSDPIRPAYISSTDEELAAAQDKAREIESYLTSWGWPMPIAANSGNGAHRVYKLDLPNDEESKGLIENFLKALNEKFGNDRVKIDESVFNAARVWKVYGTLACKGDSIPTRPHRMATIESIPDKLEIVTPEMIKAVTPTKVYASVATPSLNGTSYTQAEIESALDTLNVIWTKKDTGQRCEYDLKNRCLSSDDHTDGACVTVEPSGKAGYKCQHDTCKNKNWQDIKSVLFPHRFNGAMPNTQTSNNTNGSTQTPPPQTPPPIKPGKGQSFLVNAGPTDEGNAQVLIRLYPGRFLNCVQLSKNNQPGWLFYNGRYWEAEQAPEILDRHIVSMLIERAKAAMDEGTDPNTGRFIEEALVKFCTPNASRIQSCKVNLKSIISASIAHFDKDKDALNVNNGVVDLRTGKLTLHNSTQRFTYCIPIDYNPTADFSTWEKWLLDTVGGDLDTVKYLQMAVGYSLTGHTSEECLFYVHGPTRRVGLHDNVIKGQI